MARKPRIAALRTALAVATITVGLGAIPDGSWAHTVDLDGPRAAAAKTAREIRGLTGAYESKVRGCERRARHAAVCRVVARYRDGLRTCITDVPIRYSGHRDRTPRAEIANTRCF